MGSGGGIGGLISGSGGMMLNSSGSFGIGGISGGVAGSISGFRLEGNSGGVVDMDMDEEDRGVEIIVRWL